jgi:GT2 family glycosyltransferase
MPEWFPVSNAPKLSAVILNYREPILTIRAAWSVLSAAETAGVTAQITVVDNSAIQSNTRLLAAFESAPIRVLENSENAGFARACNQGVDASSGRILLLLNSDAFMNVSCLRLAMAYLQKNTETGIWSPRLVGEDGRPQVSCARLPTPRSIALEYLTGRHSSWYREMLTWDAPRKVGMTIAACWFLHRSTWDEVGELDERFFFTGEDVDYCKRVRATGRSVIYDPGAAIVHIGSASQPWAWVNDPYLHRGRILYAAKHHGWLAALVVRLSIWLGLSIRRLKKQLIWRAASG